MANPIVFYQGSAFFDVYTVGHLRYDNRYAQQFTANAGYTISQVSISVGANDASVPSATVYMSIQGTDENDKPDGNILASGSKAISIPYNTNQQLDFDISLLVTFNQKYHIVVYAVTESTQLRIRGDYYAFGGREGLRTSIDGGSTWSGESDTLTMGHKLYGELVAPVVTTDSAEYELYMGWEGWESILWAVTLVQRIVYTQKRLGVCYSTTNHNPTIEDSVSSSLGYYSDGKELLKYIYFATPGETYYVRAFCYFNTGYPPNEYPDLVGYGDVIEVVIPPAEPVVTTQAVTQIPPIFLDCAMGNGTIVSGSDITERGFEIKVYVDYFGVGGDIWWGLIGFHDTGEIVYHDFGQRTGYLVKIEYDHGAPYDPELGAYEIPIGKSGIFPGTVTSAFNDALEPGYEYTYRAYATNDVGTGYGAWVEFDTIADDGEYPSQDDISDADPIVPIIPIEEEPYPLFEWEEEPALPYPPWDWDLPDWEMPDYPPMSFVGDFYYRKPYTKKDLDELRKKCIIYNKNSVEFALVLRHNMNVLKEFFNMMTDYMDKEEFNDFTDLIPPQRLKELYLDPLEVNDFKDMINGFIRNTVDNNIAVNRNFKLIQDGLSDYETESDDAYFKEINSNIKSVTEDNPDVHRLKRTIDSLNQEVASNFGSIMRNLKIIRARLL